MAATIAQVAELRLLVAEATTETYTDAQLMALIEKYPLLDERGEAPYTWLATEPPTQEANTGWIATYDLHAAAADVWEVKAARLAPNYDFNADGSSLSRSQAFNQCMEMVRHHRARRSLKTFTAFKWPDEGESLTDLSYIINLPEPND